MSYFGLGNEQPVYIKDLELLYLMSRWQKEHKSDILSNIYLNSTSTWKVFKLADIHTW